MGVFTLPKGPFKDAVFLHDFASFALCTILHSEVHSAAEGKAYPQRGIGSGAVLGLADPAWSV